VIILLWVPGLVKNLSTSHCKKRFSLHHALLADLYSIICSNQIAHHIIIPSSNTKPRCSKTVAISHTKNRYETRISIAPRSTTLHQIILESGSGLWSNNDNGHCLVAKKNGKKDTHIVSKETQLNTGKNEAIDHEDDHINPSENKYAVSE